MKVFNIKAAGKIIHNYVAAESKGQAEKAFREEYPNFSHAKLTTKEIKTTRVLH